MKVKLQHRRIARIIWQNSFSGGIPDFSAIRQIIKSLRNEKRRDEEFILESLLERISLYLRENTLRISSSNELSEERQKQILSVIGNIEKFTGGIEFDKNESLIGGLRIEKGYDIEDYTVARQLEILKKTLMKN
ncbi:MAG: F0F1 ATP synthase subunit delta [Lentisphaerota bacterium]